MPSVRLGYLPSGIYQVAVTSGPASAAPRYQAPCISERLAHPIIVRRTGQNSCRSSPAGVTTPWMGNQFQQVQLGSEPAVLFLSACSSTHAPTPWHLYPKCGSKSRTPWISGDHTRSYLPGICTDFGDVDIQGHSCAKRSSTPSPNPVVGVRGIVPEDGVLVRQDFSDPDHSPSGGLVLQGVSLSALETEIPLFTDASSHGWRAQLGSCTLQATWSPQQAS